MITLSPKLILDKLDKRVVGQQDGKKAVAKMLFWHFIRYVHYEESKIWLPKQNGLLAGPSGSGKTLLVREGINAINEILGKNIISLLEVDCTEVTASGWEGLTVSKALSDHMSRLKTDAEKHLTVMFLDEFDKLCKTATDSRGTDHNKNAQYNMLKIVEGADITSGDSRSMSTPMDTRGILTVFAGNFSELRDAREVKPVLGFLEPEKAPEPTEAEKTLTLHTGLDDIGMATQLVGRVTHVAELNHLTKEELMQVLEELCIPEYTTFFRTIDVPFTVSEQDRIDIIESVFKLGTGARGLQAALMVKVDDQIMNAEVVYE